MIDYRQYCFSRKEMLQYIGISLVCGFVLLYLFYQNIIISLIISPAFVFYFLKIKKKSLCQKRKVMLKEQFKDAMDAMISALAAGYSAGHSITQAKNDLSLLYEEDSLIMCELKYMENRLADHFRLEELMLELGQRSGVNEIMMFAQVFETAQKSGGNLINIMRQTSNHIRSEMDIDREIDTLISGKRMENKCMLVVPLGIILYMQIFSPGYLDPLYNNLFGVLFMTGALVLYAGAFVLGRRLMKIDNG